MKPRTAPTVTTDEEAEAFLAQDLSGLDYGQFRPLTRRPDFSVIAALAILSLNLQQSLFTI